jgi:choline dehydrogenase
MPLTTYQQTGGRPGIHSGGGAQLWRTADGETEHPGHAGHSGGCKPSGQATSRKIAVGIEYRQGRRLYRADRQPSHAVASSEGSIRARREVILAGGAFNTPQLLLLSGIGPKQHLQDLGIPVQVDLPGVGENLQDRYEVAVVTEMKKEFSVLQDMSFTIPQPWEAPNPFYQQWLEGEGVFTTNGTVISFIKKSTPQQANPDLFIFGMPGYFAGYRSGYSKRIAEDHKHFTWAIPKPTPTRPGCGSTTDPRKALSIFIISTKAMTIGWKTWPAWCTA